MKKKLLWSLMTIFIIINIYTTSFAIKTKSNEDYNLLMPEDNVVTSENTILLSGIAKIGSNVDIYVYNSNHTLDINKLVKTPTFNTKLKVGELERFNIQLELPLGRNKIIVGIKNGVENYMFERIVNITDDHIAKEYIKNMNILENNNKKQILKSIIEK